MPTSTTARLLASLLVLVCLSAAAERPVIKRKPSLPPPTTDVSPSKEHPVIKLKLSLPPSAELHYHIEARKSGLPVNGETLIKWRVMGKKYEASSETHAMLFGKILETSSIGDIDSYGLAPTRFVDKRLRREASTTTFNRARNTISFTQSAASYPLKGGEQDRASVIWQLIAVARGNVSKFTSGSEWLFFVAGSQDAEPWRFKVTGHEKIKTGQGEVNAVHVLRVGSSQRLDIWLMPASDWYPVRLRFTESDGDFIEQTLDKVNKKTA